jgi:hypothetical protein
MRKELVGSMLTLAVVAILSLVPVPAAADQQKASSVPHTRDGKVDLRGRWLRSQDGDGRATNILEEHPGGFGITAGKSLIIDPPSGVFPYQPWALEERNRRRRPENAYADPEGKCLLSGVPRIMNFDFEILQFPDSLVMVYDYNHTTRIIPLDGRPHIPDGIRLYMADSRGHWEGDMLVVETTNQNDKNWMGLGGDFTSADAHMVERFRMLDANTFSWEITVTDPKVFTRPWTLRYGPYKRDQEPEQEQLEDSCHEGNADLVHLKNVHEAAR